MFAKYKKGIIITLVVILVLIVLTILRGDKAAEELISTTVNTVNGQQVSGANVIGSEIIQALNQIDSLNLDTSIFEDPVFLNLRDKSQDIPIEPKGRDNPFAPLESLEEATANQGDTAEEAADDEVAEQATSPAERTPN